MSRPMRIAVLSTLSIFLLTLVACSCSSQTTTGSSSTPAEDDQTSISVETETEGKSLPEELLNGAEDAYDNVVDSVQEFLEDRKTATPVYAQIGEIVQATENLAVSVLSVEPGPYDYLDKTDTVKVTVSMANTSDSTIWVKASNWDADTSNGTRVDHKIWVFGEGLKKEASSFGVEQLYPGGTFTGDLYFDAESLVAVVYEPHWLISSQNQYIYWEV